MYSVSVPIARGLGILLGVAVATPWAAAKAQPARNADTNAPASVHRMVINNGPMRSVHYIASGNISVSDRLAAYELERAENELIYLHDLQGLKQDYVSGERILQPVRLSVQEQLYGKSITSSSSNSMSGTYGTVSPMFYGYTMPFYGWGGYGGYGRGYSRPAQGFTSSSSSSVTRNLGYGMGNEGALKNALVQVIARDATSDYAAAAVNSYRNASARAAASPLLSKSLRLSREDTTPAATESGYKKGTRLVLTLKDKEKITGTVESDGPEWIVIRTDNNRVTVRKAEVVRYEESLTPGK